jgi:hypothetical protein
VSTFTETGIPPTGVANGVDDASQSNSSSIPSIPSTGDGEPLEQFMQDIVSDDQVCVVLCSVV